MAFMIGDRSVGEDSPVYFVADVAANHDGDLSRAKDLIRLCADAGADAAKFQNFSASKIVSDFGFRSLGGQQSHQASWESSVFDTYARASIPDEWTAELKAKVSVPVMQRTRIGRAGAQILTLLDDDRTFDLVVMGSHGHTGLARMLLGSVAEKVVRHARCPVLVAHGRSAAPK